MKFKAAILTFIMFFACGMLCAQSNIYIGIEGSKIATKTPLGLSKFTNITNSIPSDSKNAVLNQDEMYDIVRSDLLLSRYFNLKEGGPVISTDTASVAAELALWKNIEASYVVTADIRYTDKGFVLNGRVYEVLTGKVVLSKNYTSNFKQFRKAGHTFSDDIIKQTTGNTGISRSQIAYSCDKTGSKEIYVVDYDGKNPVKLTSHKSISLLPVWNIDGTKIYYTTYRYKNPDIFEIDLGAGKIRPFSVKQGLNIAGGLSPDGKDMTMVLSRGNNPSIYRMNLKTKKLTRLTNPNAVSSSVSYSPDGSFITFVSDMHGNPQVYTMELATGVTQRLTRFNWSDSPKWSPSGEWIVFAGRQYQKQSLDIYLVDVVGAQVRQLTQNSGSNEDPSWSPDGRFITFTSTRNGKRELFVMDADGSAPHRLLDTGGNVFTPQWSR